MQKPNDWNSVQAYGGYTPLKLGGHICKIMQVKETKSKAGRDMLEISLDIAEGDQKDYFTQQYKTDTRENKKWGCIIYQLEFDNEGNTTKGLKSFVTSVEESNPGFQTLWGNKFSVCFNGKLVGGVFGRDPYINQKGEKKYAVKCFYFRSVDVIRAGVEIPADRELRENTGYNMGYAHSYTQSGVDGFMNIPDGIDEELPFN